MEAINKLGRVLAKDFEKKFEGFTEEQMSVLKNTKLYRLFVNKPNSTKRWHIESPPRLARRFYNNDHRTYDQAYSNQYNIIGKLYLDNIQLKDNSIKETVSDLLKADDVSNNIIAVNILKNAKIK